MKRLEPLPFKEALTFWADKIKIGPKDFLELSDNAKTIAFAVSRIAIGDELNTVYRLLEDSLSNGTGFETFKAGASDILERRGWTGRNAYKAEGIFRTNIQSAFNAGQFQVLDRNRDIFPYWQYSAIEDSRTSPFCRFMNNKVYPADHPIWERIFPPNHYSCRSTVVGLTAEQVAGDGLTVEQEDFVGKEVALSDGEVVVISPDEGFLSNPGKVWKESIGRFADKKLADYPSALSLLVLQELLTSKDVSVLLNGIPSN